MQISPQDEGVGEEPECVVYCHSWQRHAPAPETPSRQETGTAWDPMPALLVACCESNVGTQIDGCLSPAHRAQIHTPRAVLDHKHQHQDSHCVIAEL